MRSRLRDCHQWVASLVLAALATFASHVEAIVVSNAFVSPCFNTFVPDDRTGANTCLEGNGSFATATSVLVGASAFSPGVGWLTRPGLLTIDGNSQLRSLGGVSIGWNSGGTVLISGRGAELVADSMSVSNTLNDTSTLLIEGGGRATARAVEILSGAATISGAGSLLTGSVTVRGFGAFSVIDQAMLNFGQIWLYGGIASFRDGASAVGGRLHIENAGFLEIASGSTVDATQNEAGASTIYAGTLNVVGAGSKLIVTSLSIAGNRELPDVSSGLSVANGAVVEVDGKFPWGVGGIDIVSYGAAGRVQVRGSGSKLSVLNGFLHVYQGASDISALSIENGGAVVLSSNVTDSTHEIGINIGTQVTSESSIKVSGSGSLLSVRGGFLNVGSKSNGLLTIETGAAATVSSTELIAASMIIGEGWQEVTGPVKGRGKVLVRGAGSSLSFSGLGIQLGLNRGDGYLNVESGGKLVAEGENIRLGIGQHNGSAWATVIDASVEISGTNSLLDVAAGEMSFGALTLADSATVVLTGSSATMGIGRFGGEGILSIATGATLALRGDLATLSVGMAGGTGSARVDGLRSNITVEGRGAYIFVGDREGRGLSTLDVVGSTV